jgi:YggT family protein
VLLVTLAQIIGYIISVVVILVIVQFVVSLLFAFNVISPSNDFMMAIYRSVNALLEPILAPIRRIMPNTGQIDFSPLVLIVGLNILRILVTNAAIASY